MKSKKLAILALSGIMALSLTACSNGDESKVSQNGSETVAAEARQADFTIVDITAVTTDDTEYFDVEVTVQNNTDEAKNFLGFEMVELDADGNITDSYMSYNKNSCETVVEPGQQFTITLGEPTSVAGMQSSYCEWGEFSSPVKCEFAEPYKVMF